VTLAELEEVAVDWFAATHAQGQEIPEPTESASYSGKFVTRMSKTLHRKAAQFALRDGVSLNQYIVNCVAERVGMHARPAMIYAQAPKLQANFTLQLSANWPLLAAPLGRIQSTTPSHTVHVPRSTAEATTDV